MRHDCRLRFLILARSLGRGGAERQIAQLARSIVGAGHDVTVVLFYGGGVFEQDLRERGIPVLDLQKNGPWDFLGSFRRLLALIRTYRPHAVYSFMLGPNIFAALLKPFVDNVKIIWGIRTSSADWRVYGRGAVVAAYAETVLARLPDLIICNSEAGRSTCLDRGFPKHKVIVVPNGIDTTLFCPDDEARQRTRAMWGINDGELVIGLVGRLDPHKRHRLFIDAMRQVVATLPAARAVCVGDGAEPYASNIKRYGNAVLDGTSLIWISSQDDMRGVYNAIDLLVLCSSVEGFPNVLAEAMACGTPVVTTLAGDSARIVNDEARIVKTADPAELAEAIVRCASAPRLKVGQQHRDRICKHFSLERATTQFLWPASQ